MKINYSKDVTLQLNDELLTINAKGEVYELEVEQVVKKDKGATAELKGKYEGGVTIKESGAHVYDLNKNEVYIDEDGLSSTAVDGFIFFKQ
jgi:hypothetical protein